MKKILITLLAVGLMVGGMTSCQDKAQHKSDLLKSVYERNKPEKEVKEIQTEENKEVTNSQENSENIDYSKLTFTDYYCVVGKSKLAFQVLEPGEIEVYDLDELGRPTGANAHLNYELVNKERSEDRELIKVDPIGWVNNKKVVITEDNGKSYKGYFYNRSHLLADSLGGPATKENLITGTRTQNVGIKNQGGMAYTEEKAREFFKHPTNETLIYQVQPIYLGNEIVPRWVIVNVKSSDNSIDELVVVSNSANGYTIDYNTGNWHKN